MATRKKKGAKKSTRKKEKTVSETVESSPEETPETPETPGETSETPTVETPAVDPTAEPEPEPEKEPEPEPEPEEETPPEVPPAAMEVAPPPMPSAEELLAKARARLGRVYELDNFKGPSGQSVVSHLVKNAPPLWRDKKGGIVAGDVWAKLPDYVQERIAKHVALHMAGLVVCVPKSYGVDKLNALMKKHFPDGGGAGEIGDRVLGASSGALFADPI